MYLQIKVKKKNLKFIYTIVELYIKVTYTVGKEIYLGGEGDVFKVPLYIQSLISFIWSRKTVVVQYTKQWMLMGKKLASTGKTKVVGF